jgi:aryl-alcohol dehydrogenase-like predicted oxidoreductase
MSQTLPVAVLGRTGIEVTRLGFGTAVGGLIEHDQWRQLLNEVLDQGINFIDTANDYGIGWGRPAEEMIGQCLEGRRHEYRIATKCGCSPSGHIWTRENLFRGLHESLERLRTDYVDVMLLHNPTVDECEGGELVRALQDMREQGKVRWIGASTNLPEVPTFLEWGVFDAFQLPYSALERDHEDWITQAAQAGIGIIIRGGVAQGEPGVGSGDVDRWQLYDQAALDKIRPPDESRTGFMLRYTLSHPDTHTIIVGTRNVEHLNENLQAALRGPLPHDLHAEINRRLDGVG